ncbi:matrixin family metalloprotease [Candidatus Microgenomates bacterium]|nr:matrixin family metalloprotease [Candidatus Microgenomates bacterium]
MDASITDYEARVKSFNERSAALSEKIKGLDIHDPEYKQKFDEVYKESEDLNREADELNKLAATLNQSTESYNQQVANLNSTISRLNATLAQKPEEGIYNPDGDVIEIYITSSEKELIHTLAHEFGHSLGIDHIENKEAIMYPYSTQLLKTTEEDVNAVTAACKERVRE